MDFDTSDAGCFGDPAAIRVQRVLFAARGWIGEQERMVSHGHALLLLHAQRFSEDKLEAWVRCFERILAHAPRSEMPSLVETLRAVGARAGDDLALYAAAASDVRAAAAGLERARPLPRGWMLAEIPEGASPEAVRAVQEIQAASGVTPLPGWYLRGADGRAVTLVLRDGAGAVVGAATACVALGPGEAAPGGGQLDLLNGSGAGKGEGGDLPSFTGMPVSLCIRPDARGQGHAPVLGGAALRAACERFGLRRFYAVIGARDEAAIRVATRCGFTPHPTEGVVLAEPG
jgi:GNAT superfamily N-acetyltransferase